MGIYQPLAEYLAAAGEEQVRLSFSNLEEILGFSLPESAYTFPAWWSNSGGHTQAKAWGQAGYRVSTVNLKGQSVLFVSQADAAAGIQSTEAHSTMATRQPTEDMGEPGDGLFVCGYRFRFLQQLVPEMVNDVVLEFHPQVEYENPQGLRLLPDGEGTFCRFSIDGPAAPGVYLWVLDGEILYIGETTDLWRRFNEGYGHISPRTCYAGGQNTNCRMNQVVLAYARAGRAISLYFYQTSDHKRVELELLQHVETQYNRTGSSARG